jgi:hypothetical protein
MGQEESDNDERIGENRVWLPKQKDSKQAQSAPAKHPYADGNPNYVTNDDAKRSQQRKTDKWLSGNVHGGNASD